jgi:hypothetical protein
MGRPVRRYIQDLNSILILILAATDMLLLDSL